VPVTKEEKQERIAEILEKVRKSQVVYVTTYQGMTTTQLNTLRGKLKEFKAGYHVVKNTLAARALEQAGMAVPTDLLEGPVAFGFAYENIGATAKALLDFGRESDKFQVKGAVLGRQVLSSKDVVSLSNLPPLNVVRAQLIGILSAPAGRFAGVVAGGVRQVVNVVKAYAEKDGEGAAQAA
jgi:large subunit ribosomal protein L10